VTKIPVTHKNGHPRAGDPAVLTADAGKFIAASGWKPRWSLEDIISHAWAWYHK
jgi:UDP-glucose 4-epimerase